MPGALFLATDLENDYEYTDLGKLRLALLIKASVALNEWSLRHLARLAGISHVTLLKYLKCQVVTPDRKTLKAIAPYIHKIVRLDVNAEIIEIDKTNTYQDWKDLAYIASSNFEADNLGVHLHLDREQQVETLPELIQAFLKKEGLSRAQFAEECDITLEQLQDVLDRKRLPCGDTEAVLASLAAILTDPRTGQPFCDWVELATYCRLLEDTETHCLC